MELRETKCGILCLLDREELKMLNQKEVKKTDYPQLISLWRSSVEVVLPDYFQQVQLSMWLNEEQKCVGFSGTNQQTLEMLFIDPVYFRKGYGGEIIKKLIEQESIVFVDANKQNEGAVKFYQSQGFQVIGESKEDPQGNPFPILHMKRI